MTNKKKWTRAGDVLRTNDMRQTAEITENKSQLRNEATRREYHGLRSQTKVGDIQMTNKNKKWTLGRNDM